MRLPDPSLQRVPPIRYASRVLMRFMRVLCCTLLIQLLGAMVSTLKVEPLPAVQVLGPALRATVPAVAEAAVYGPARVGGPQPPVFSRGLPACS